MVRELIHDPFMLSIKSVPADSGDADTVRDLLDTLLFHKDGCVGMAANMIGVHKRIIVFFDGSTLCAMLNPEIMKAEGPYEAREGCLSLLGDPRPAGRFRKIKVRWQTETLQSRIKTFTGFTAQIIQHEIDHCNGILI